MAASKHIDRICILAAVFTLLLTALFMNGRRLGLTVMADEDAGDGQFTANDLDADWAGGDGDATQITLTGDGAEIRGNGAYFYDGSVRIVYAGRYIVTGQLDHGGLVVDADKDDKIRLLLDGASVRNEDGAALLVEQAEKVFLTLADGTENELAGWTDSDGADTAASAQADPADGASEGGFGRNTANGGNGQNSVSGGNSQDDATGGVDGAIYSRDDLTINGTGSLTVTTGYQHAIVCNDDLVITGGHISVTAPQDGLHANDSVRIANADLTVHAGDDGVTVSNDENTGYFYMESGSIAIPSCYEGIEAIDITICGGDLDITPTDDGINANGYGTSSITIAGGNIRIVNPTGRDADGLDSNGSIYVTGGNIFISMNGNGSNCALDCGTESGGVCEISGGTVIAAGGSGMAEGFDSSSEQCFIMQTVSATAENASVALINESGETLLSDTVPCSFTSLILSTPRLRMGETCTVVIDGTETEVVVDNSSAGGFGMGGRFGRMGGGMTGGMGGGMTGKTYDGTTGGMPGAGRRGRLNDETTQDGGELPQPQQAPDGESPQQPNGQRPQLPDGESLPQAPGGAPSQSDQNNDALQSSQSSDDQQSGQDSSVPLPGQGNDPLQSDQDSSVSQADRDIGAWQPGQGSDTWQPGQDGGFLRGQRQNPGADRITGPADADGAGSVSSETWLLIGVSALCLAAGLLAAWRTRH